MSDILCIYYVATWDACEMRREFQCVDFINLWESGLLKGL